MARATVILRWLGVVAALSGVAFLLAPVNTAVSPLEVPNVAEAAALPADSRVHADSLTEDIILHNIFSASRAAPSRRSVDASANADAGEMSTTPAPQHPGFTPELIGTAVSGKPDETRALLRLTAADAAPRLYAVGDRAGGFTVVSIDARAVVLTGPRGRVVLRLPENEESHS